jgi:putative endopeptidase
MLKTVVGTSWKCVLRISLSAMVFLAAVNTANAAPQYGAWGFDSSAMDLSVKPGDDFNRYASGAWLARTTIPADKALFTLRMTMTDAIESRLHELMESAAASAQVGTLDAKAGAFYKAFMDNSKPTSPR